MSLEGKEKKVDFQSVTCFCDLFLEEEYIRGVSILINLFLVPYLPLAWTTV